ncbi:hypothetical protein [Daejeonella oryzae]|uniref:hypothetical protein n=1 Tax=Daejeonella oryzae TaxID=1122943 RepID=UPI00047C6ED5|nr:hypothetical protein [Daejeonella oryzae]
MKSLTNTADKVSANGRFEGVINSNSIVSPTNRVMDPFDDEDEFVITDDELSSFQDIDIDEEDF